jgi:uncharacterized protein YuzE
MIEIKLDKKADAVYIRIKKGRVHKTKASVGGDSLIDLNKKGEVLGIELLHYSKTFQEKDERRAILIGERQFPLAV